MLGVIPNFAGTLAYGIGEKQNSIDSASKLITNNTLQFELGRAAVVGSSLDLSNNSALVYSATINDSYQYQIHEVGLFPSSLRDANVGLGGSLLFDFDRVDLFNKFGTGSGSFLTTVVEARVGTSLFYIPPMDGTTSYLSYSSLNNTLAPIDLYVSQDTFRLAGFKDHSQAASVIFTFQTDSLNYYNLIFPVPSASGYFITELEKGLASIVGNPSWINITSTLISLISASGLYLDGLKIDFGSYYNNTNTGMISRAILANPIRKPAGIPLTIEYSLTLDFNYGLA